MPSLFSRSRTASTPKKPTLDAAFDEFGRITSRGSSKFAARTVSPIPTSKKDKKKESKDKARARTISTTTAAEPDPSEFTLPDGSFLPLNLEPPRYNPGEEPSLEHRNLIDYGYLCYQRHVVLGLEEVARLVDVVGEELGTRGLTTPFIFSCLALDVSASSVKRLIQAFLRTCGRPSHEADRLWREEARFAGPHELGMCLRWGLARVVRIIGGHEVRGLVSYDNYCLWREAETALNYPATHFGRFIDHLEPLLQSLLVGLFTLLTRFTAHSSSSGHTPPTLSALFGPLLFGLGPSTLAFHHVYVHYLRAATATEHLILAFIRWQDAPGHGSSSANALGVPTRLKAWIQGYPSMLPVTKKNERPQPRRGARTVRLVSVRRNVRIYSADLVKTAASWGIRSPGQSSSAGNRSFAGSKEWERISPPTLKLPPRYSESYRKRMVLPPNFHPETGPGSSSSTVSAPSLASTISTASTASSFFDGELGMLGKKPEEDRFRSLTDLKWGEFEAMGFGGLGDEKKLQFDLTESARAARAAKRATLSWQDFSAAGFSRNDAPLSATLQFNPSVASTMQQWPTQSAELHRKLKKTQKALPPFGWDTEPIMGAEEVIEEAFIDVFCDLIYGGGWMDAERAEEVDRDCNWALVEFKSLPVSRSGTVSGTSDPRNSTTLFLFEEFVPLEYRQSLHDSGATRRRLPSLFGTKKHHWKPATTLNGRPYVIGHVPRSPSYREVEFEGLLSSNGSVTKVISLKTPERQPSTYTNSVASPISTIAPSPIITKQRPQIFLTPTRAETPVKRPSSRQSDVVDSPTPTNETHPASANPHRKSSRFRLPVSPVTSRTAGLPPAEYDTVDFEARLASFDDEPLPTSVRSKHSRRQSKDDAWVDILVASSSRRMPGQDVDLRNALKSGRSDPELASQEVSEVLAAVRQIQSDDEDDMEPIQSLHSTVSQQDVSTVGGSEIDHDTVDTHSAHVAYEDEEEEEEPVVMPIPKRRLGYFDLHPERRGALDTDGPASVNVTPPTPPAASSLAVPRAPPSPMDDARAHISRHSMLDDPRSLFERPSLDDSNEDAYDSEPETPIPSVPSKEHIGGSSSYRSSPIQRDDLGEERGAVSSHSSSPSPHDVSEVIAPKQPQSRTASLIEMYREKERSATTASPVPASKLPIRTGASLAPLSQHRERSVSPVPALASNKTPSPPRQQAELEEPHRASPKHFEPDVVPITPPAPYVHGAPLHNVLEEEEEEEE
ncbi:hypothetical protein C8Q75DRAFT_805635 [Abortiporus biennis]|nr:hypothetical protein C8Q75DRAFT_805635 [Abortiporus biennis]